MVSSKKSPDENVDPLQARADQLAARVEQLEAELRRREATDETVRKDRKDVLAQIEAEVEALEEDAREQRIQRAALIEAIDAEMEEMRTGQRDEKVTRIEQLQEELRRLEQRQRKTLADRLDRLREFDMELKYGQEQSRSVKGRRPYERARRLSRESSVTGKYARSPWDMDVFNAIGDTVLVGFLDLLGASADMLNSFTDEVYARNRARAERSATNMAVYFPGDIYSGFKAAVDRARERLGVAYEREAQAREEVSLN